MMKKVKERREGFTMAELLIVVAIIAVLVAIAIPVFNSQLEKSREATDAANLRSAYSECSAAAITAPADVKGYYKQVDPTQTSGDGFTTIGDAKIGTVALNNLACVKGTPIFVNVGVDGKVTIGTQTTGFDACPTTSGV